MPGPRFAATACRLMRLTAGPPAAWVPYCVFDIPSYGPEYMRWVLNRGEPLQAARVLFKREAERT